MKIYLDFVPSTNCAYPFLAKLNILSELPYIAPGEHVYLEMNTADPSELYNVEYRLRYMSDGIFMDYEPIFMGGDPIPSMVTEQFEITDQLRDGQEIFYMTVDPLVLTGQKSLLFRLVYEHDSISDSSEFVLGYKGVDILPLAGKTRLNVTPMRQAFRGNHMSTKYNRTFWGIERDITTIEDSISSSLYVDYTPVLRLNYLSELIRM